MQNSAHKRTRVLSLETGIVYGPVLSRRLGLSLGINLLPSGYKLCSFDCIYCHYGRTHVKTMQPAARDLPWTQEVLRAVEVALRKTPDVDYLTFSGNGEPTLHPAFPEIAAAVARLRDRVAPDVKLALFSNATTLQREDVRAALAHFEMPMLKLDAGDPETLAAINGPAPELTWTSLLEGLKAMPGAIIQSVLVEGPVSNARVAALAAWAAALAEIRPAHVYIYSTEYPVPEAGVAQVLPYQLQQIAQRVGAQTGVPVHARWIWCDA